MDVTGIEPVTTCLQSRPGKILTALSGVAYTETDKFLVLSNVPKLYRVRRFGSSAHEGNDQDTNDTGSIRPRVKQHPSWTRVIQLPTPPQFFLVDCSHF